MPKVQWNTKLTEFGCCEKLETYTSKCNIYTIQKITTWDERFFEKTNFKRGQWEIVVNNKITGKFNTVTDAKAAV